jgi:hypothetical protein
MECKVRLAQKRRFVKCGKTFYPIDGKWTAFILSEKDQLK